MPSDDVDMRPLPVKAINCVPSQNTERQYAFANWEFFTGVVQFESSSLFETYPSELSARNLLRLVCDEEVYQSPTAKATQS